MGGRAARPRGPMGGGGGRAARNVRSESPGRREVNVAPRQAPLLPARISLPRPAPPRPLPAAPARPFPSGRPRPGAGPCLGSAASPPGDGP